MHSNEYHDLREKVIRDALGLMDDAPQHANGWKSGDDGVYEVAMSAEERLQSAAEVVKSLQREMDIRSDEHDAALAEIQELKALLMDFQRFMRHHARRLAVAGSYDHKGKNEVLLSVIGGLLDAAENAIRVTTVEDVPF